jgi:ligand-binding sensor domain-containing protein
MLSTNTPLPRHVIQSTNTPISTLVPTLTPTGFSTGWFTYGKNSNEWVQDLSFDSNGFLWAATDGGLVKWNPIDGTYQKFTRANDLPSSQVTGVYVDSDGVVWIGTAGGGIASFENNEFTEYQSATDSEEAITDIIQDSQGTIWFSNRGTGGIALGWITLPHTRGNGWLTITKDDQVLSTPSDKQSANWPDSNPEFEALSKEMYDLWVSDIFFITVATPDKNGGLWIGTWNHGVIYFNGQTYEYFSVKDGSTGNSPYYGIYISDIEIDHNGTIWFATFEGIFSYDGIQTEMYANAPGAISIAIAPDNSLWVGTVSSGISHFDGTDWHAYRTDDKMPSTIHDIASTSNGGIWLATDRGAIFTDGHSWRAINDIDGLPIRRVKFVGVAPDQSLWIGTEEGCIIKFEAQESNWYCDDEFKGLDVNSFRELDDIAFDEHGGVWVISYGVWYFDGDTWTEYLCDSDFKIFDVIRSEHIAISPKLGVFTDASYFDGENWKYYNKHETRGIAIAPDGDVWVAIRGTIKSYNGVDWEVRTKLPDNNYNMLDDITDMAFAKDGHLWIATGEGAYEYDVLNDSLMHYTVADGLAGNVVNKIHMANDGAIWFLTNGGLTRFSFDQ